MNSSLQAYRQHQFEGFSEDRPVALIGALLDEVIIAIQAAAIANDQQRHTIRGEKISRAIKLITEGLQPALNFEEGADIAQNFLQIYQYCIDQLIQANIQKNSPLMNECAQLLVQIREGWREVERQYPHA